MLFSGDFSRVLLNQRDLKLPIGQRNCPVARSNDFSERRAPGLSRRCEAWRPENLADFFFADGGSLGIVWGSLR
ncbi:MAG TPA: hypothetical protein VE111_09245 [Bradyrhizobium sp.]|nr:hypothetical protein [Bradyrhizobium sp.]